MRIKYVEEEKCRDYWRETMEARYDFMMKIMDYPVRECLEPLVSLPEVLKGAGIEVRFSRRQLTKAQLPIFCLRSGLIKNFLLMAEAMNRQDWVLRVEEAYRNKEMRSPLNRKETVLEETIGVLPCLSPPFPKLVHICPEAPWMFRCCFGLEKKKWNAAVPILR